ncbi:hypothetical protein HDU79_011009 [Rhizoclosmatium sp. JEL0117]|nr:hypothetical protein HDU79_011009 [Rhizoclosmatium sp. JEL0117]
MSDISDAKLETFVFVPSDISRQIRTIVLVLSIFIGIILGIPECEPYYTGVFLITFSVFTSAAHLRLQAFYYLYFVPIFYLYLVCCLGHPLNIFISFHAILNVCILATAYILGCSPLRTSPTVLLTTAIITEDTKSFPPMFLALAAMQFVVIQTASLLADLPYPIQLFIQGLGAAIPFALFYAISYYGLDGLGNLNNAVNLQLKEGKKEEESLWNKVRAWHQQVARDKASVSEARELDTQAEVAEKKGEE